VGAVGADLDLGFLCGGGGLVGWGAVLEAGGVGLWFGKGLGGAWGGGRCGGAGGEWWILAGTAALVVPRGRVTALEDAGGLSGDLM